MWKNYMRIISGKFKGRNLVSFKADHIRPTMDRVKETLFNKWMHEVDDSLFLDLFSGTGSLGLEALSRGARHVTFVEKSNKSIQIIKENLYMEIEDMHARSATVYSKNVEITAH